VSEPTHDRPAAIDVEYELRKEWWGNHGHEYLALYGDDGEMQCLRCLMDFKRAPLEIVQAAVFTARLERAAEFFAKEAETDA
jgi:hypothetical protein